MREAWIGEQTKFHTGKKQSEGRARKRLARASEIAIPVTIEAPALHLLLVWQAVGPAGGVFALSRDGETPLAPRGAGVSQGFGQKDRDHTMQSPNLI
jgi:hypothetical protein